MYYIPMTRYIEEDVSSSYISLLIVFFIQCCTIGYGGMEEGYPGLIFHKVLLTKPPLSE